jgi:integrase
MSGMFNRRAADIILAAPTTWSTTIMTDNRETCVDPYLDSFAQSFAAANYTAGTIRTYRHLARKLGRLMGTGGIAPSALCACPNIAAKRVMPHTLRHSTAMDLLHHGVDQAVIALWLDTNRSRPPRSKSTPRCG